MRSGQQSGNILDLEIIPTGFYQLILIDSPEALATNFLVFSPVTGQQAWPFGVETHFAQTHDPAISQRLLHPQLGDESG